MVIKALIEGFKSLAAQSLASSSERNQVAPLSAVFIGVVASISLILAEIFFGLSIYKALHFDYGHGEGLSMLIATLIYVIQVVISTLIIKHHLKKMATESIMIKEYRFVKGIVTALIEGYKSKN